MLMIACSNATTLDKETATTSLIKSDKHIWDREGRALNLGKDIGQGSLITSEAAWVTWQRKVEQKVVPVNWEWRDQRDRMFWERHLVQETGDGGQTCVTEGNLLIARPAELKKSSQGEGKGSWVLKRRHRQEEWGGQTCKSSDLIPTST